MGKYWWEEDNKQAKDQQKKDQGKGYWWEKDGTVTNTATNNITDRVNSWLTNHSSYVSDYQNRFSGRKGTYEDSYVSDSASWLDKVSKQKSNFDAEADSILAYMDQYKGYLDAKWMDDVRKTIAGARDQQKSIYDSAVSDNQWWSSFGSEDLVKQYGSAEEAYKYFQRGDGYNKKYAGMTNEDIQNALLTLSDGEEKDWLESYQWGRLRSEEDFEQYSSAGAAIKNPTMTEAEGDGRFLWFTWDGADIGNIVTYSRDNADLLAAAKANNANVQGNYVYRSMTDDEVKIYNYLLAKYGKEKGDEYLSYMMDTLLAREGGDLAGRIKGIDIPVVEELATGAFGVLAGVDQWASGTRQFLRDEKQPATVEQYANSEIANSFDDLGKYAYQATNVIGNMLPSIAMSKTLGALGAGVKAAKAAGAVTMSIGAAGNAYKDGIEKYGMKPWQARIYGTLVGAAEGGLEYAIGGIPALRGAEDFIGAKIDMIDKSLLRIGAKLGWDVLQEIGEEELQNFLEPAFRAIFTGEYDAPTIDELLETAIVTAISTPVMGGLDTVLNDVHVNRANSKAVNDYGNKTDTLIQEGLGNDVKSESYKLAQQYQQQVQGKNGKGGKALTGAQIRNLLAANQEQVTAKDMQLIQQAAEKRLAKLGQKTDVSKIAELATRYATGGKLTRAERSFLVNSEYGPQVTSEMLGNNKAPDNLLSRWENDMSEGAADNFSTEWAENIGTKSVNRETFDREAYAAEVEATVRSLVEQMQKVSEDPNANQSQDDKISTAANTEDSTATLEEASEKYGAQAQAMIHTYQAGQDIAKYDQAYKIIYDMGKSGVSLEYAKSSPSVSYLTATQRELAYAAGQDATGIEDEEKTSLNETGESVKVKEIASLSDGKMTLTLESGETVDADQVTFSINEALLYNAISDMDISAKEANQILQGYDGSTTAEAYASGISEAYHYGQMGVPYKSIDFRGYAAAIPAQVRKNAYQMGRRTLATTKSERYNDIISEKEDAGDGTGENLHLRRGIQRTDRAGTDRPVRGVEEAAGGVQNRQAAGRSEGNRADHQETEGRVNAADLGIRGGTGPKNLTSVPMDYSADTKEAATAAAEQGVETVFFTGDNLHIEYNGSVINARACIVGKRIYVRADHPDFTALQLTRHEMAHEMFGSEPEEIRNGKIHVQKVYERLVDLCGTEEVVKDLIRMYAEAYDMGYDGTEEMAMEVFTEIVCDSEADMNAFAPEDRVSMAPFMVQIKHLAEDAVNNRDTRGPPAGKTAKFSRAARGRSIELETMENNRFERLRQFYGNLPAEWYSYTRDFFYIYSNQSYTDYTILAKVSITSKNRAAINDFTEALENGTYEHSKTFDSWTSHFRRGKGRYSWDSVRNGSRSTTVRTNGMDGGKRGGKYSRNSEGSGGIGPKLKFSREADRAYLDAVEHADMNTAQRMVDEAAKRAGFPEKLYHGTMRGFGFTKIDPNKAYDKMSFFATDSLELARTYSQDDGAMNIALAQELGLTAGNYQLYANTDGFIEVDAKGGKWDFIQLDQKTQEKLNRHAGDNPYARITETVDTMKLAECAKMNGYPGVKVTNVFDQAWIAGGDYHQTKPATVYIFLNPQAQVKSADPVTYDNNGDVIPLSERFDSDNKDIRFSRETTDDAQLKAVNESMTMTQAKQMIQRAFVLGGIQEWYDNEYKNGDEWLRGEGAADVALIIENEYSLQSAYLDKIQGILDGDFYVEDVLEAYLAGTLTGKAVKKNTGKIDLSSSVAVADKRFYAPKAVENAKTIYETANLRMTRANQAEVTAARAQVLLYAHNRGAAETLGLTEAELNRKLRSWSNYSAAARDISLRINSGVQVSNRWTGIENMSYVARAQVSAEDVARMVKAVEGRGNAYQNNYIGRAMLALDTHIDWSWLTFKFDTYAGVNEKSSTKCNGYYMNSKKYIHVMLDAPNTVAHEMGHALDYQWARELGLSCALTEAFRNTKLVTGDAKVWFDHFKEFTDSLVESSDIRSAYSGDIKETFARFVDKFVAWTEQLATGRNTTFERSFYNDKFTGSQFVQFARLLQEKAALDANGKTLNKSFSSESVMDEGQAKFSREFIRAQMTEKEKQLQKVNESLAKDNLKLRGDIEYLRQLLKLQREVTGGTKFTRSSVEAMARQLKTKTNAGGDTKELAAILNSFYEFVATSKELSWEDVMEQAQEAAAWLLEHKREDFVRDEYAQLVLDDLWGRSFYLDDVQKGEAVYAYGSYQAFRQKVFNTVTPSDKASMSLDELWQEMAAAHPYYFPEETTAGDQVRGLVDAIETLRTAKAADADAMSDNSKEMEIRELLHDVYDSYWRVSTLRTVADSMQKEINGLKSKHYAKMDQVKREHKEAKKQLETEYRQRMSALREEYKARTEEKIRKVKDANRESRKRENARRKEAEAVKKNRAVVEKAAKVLMDMLAHPTKDAHVPTALHKPLQEFLEAIDFSSKTQYAGKSMTIRDVAYTRALAEVRAAIAGQRSAMEGKEDGTFELDIPDSFLEEIDTHIRAINSATKGLDLTTNRVYDMTSDELADLGYMLKVINKAIRDIDKLHIAGAKARVSELGQNTRLEMSKRKPVKGESGGSAMWANYTPWHAFRRMGKAAQQIFKGLMQGQAKLARTINSVIQFTKTAYTVKEAKAWERKKHTINLDSGKTISMTPAQIMSFYCLSKREHAMGHMMGGGIRISTIKEGARKLVQKEHYTLTEQDIVKISNLLTDRQRAVAEQLQQYMQDVGGRLNNEISMARWDYMAATEEHYFPIKTDDSTRDVKDPGQEKTNLWALLNKSFTKGLTPGANNAMVVESIFDVFADHMSEVAEYNAFALPLVDAMKWFNYRERIQLDETHIKDVGVQKAIRDALGTSAVKYFVDLMTDINSSQKAGRHENLAGQILSRSKVASVGWNLRVAIQQPTAILRASMILDVPSLLKGTLRIGTKDLVSEMQKYSGIALWKSMGYYDLNVSRSVREQIKGDDSLLDKFNEFGMWLPGKMDEITWARIWAATKVKVAKEQKLTGEALLQATAELFEEIVYQTQVADSVLTRSSMMRSKSQFMKEATAFMAEPTVSANILLSAFQDYEEGHTAWDKTKRGLMIGFCGYAMSSVVNAIATALMDAWRDDDEYEEYWEKFRQALLGEKSFFDGNLFSELNPLEKIVFVKDFLSLLKGYDVTPGYAELFQSAIDLVDNFKKLMNGKGSITEYGVIYQSLHVLSGVTGFGASNIAREVIGVWNNTIGKIYPNMLVHRYDTATKSKIRNAYDTNALTDLEAMQMLIDNGVAENEDEAKADVEYWKFQRNHPDIHADDQWFHTYYKKVSNSGIGIELYIQYRNKLVGVEGKEDRMAVIHTMPMTKSQKDALYLAEGWSQNTIGDAPWH